MGTEIETLSPGEPDGGGAPMLKELGLAAPKSLPALAAGDGPGTAATVQVAARWLPGQPVRVAVIRATRAPSATFCDTGSTLRS